MRARPAPLASLLLLTSACSSDPAPASQASTDAGRAGWHVAGGALRDPEGRAVMLRGANVSGANKNEPYFDFHREADLARMRDWGMRSMRFLVIWAAIEPAKGAYDVAYLDAVAERMSWARQAGITVVLDMHQDLYGEGFSGDGAPRWTCDESHYKAYVPSSGAWFLNYLNPEMIACYDHFWQSDELKSHYAEAWRRLAARLAGYDDVIIGFDPMNEPYWGSQSMLAFEAATLQPFYEEVVAAVRAERPGWVAFTEPASSRNLGVPTGLTPFSFGDVVYSPHSYDRDAEGGKGFDPSHRAAVLANFESLAGEASSLGAALWVGEYGGMAASPGIGEYMTAEYDGMAAVNAGSAYWDYGKGGGYSFLDADGTERPALVAALVRPWAERVAGTPVSQAFDAKTSAYTLRFRPDPAVAAPTILAVPDRLYPNGVRVECGGCAVTRAPGEALLGASSGQGGEVTVSLHP
jgi:endoglycosylceramidase